MKDERRNKVKKRKTKKQEQPSNMKKKQITKTIRCLRCLPMCHHRS
jgi:hypothetical protein